MNNVSINGVKYPIRFGLRAYRDFENHTGKTIGEIDPKKIKIGDFVTLCYFALAEGAKKSNQKLDPDKDIEWLLDEFDNDENVIEAFTNVLVESQQKHQVKPRTGKKTRSR